MKKPMMTLGQRAAFWLDACDRYLTADHAQAEKDIDSLASVIRDAIADHLAGMETAGYRCDGCGVLFESSDSEGIAAHLTWCGGTLVRAEVKR